MSETYTLPADSESSIMDVSGIAEGPNVEHEPSASGQYSYYDGGIFMGYDPAHKKENDELLRRLAAVSNRRKPTWQERRRWKVSFVMWMIGHKPGITREFVEEILDEMYGC